MDLSFRGREKRLEDIDLPKLGSRLGVGEDEMHAFIDAETLGHGFDGEGRPVMLFEPHVFWRNLDGAKRAAAVAKGLAYRRWGHKPYPQDSYPRLKAAIGIDQAAALKSASWGLGQVLGENFSLAGFASVEAMVSAMIDDEEAQLAAAVEFIRNSGLADALRTHNWTAFARGYNGPGYRKNGYHTKLAAAFARWQRIRDTPWAAEPPVATEAPVAVEQPPVVHPAPEEPSAEPGAPFPAPPATSPSPDKDPGSPARPAAKGWLAALAATLVVGVAAAWHWLAALPCTLTGVFCA